MLYARRERDTDPDGNQSGVLILIAAFIRERGLAVDPLFLTLGLQNSSAFSDYLPARRAEQQFSCF